MLAPPLLSTRACITASLSRTAPDTYVKRLSFAGTFAGAIKPRCSVITRSSTGEMSPTQAKQGITLYTAGTPNGWKASILLEELGIPYNVQALSLGKNEQKEPWFININPNGRIPAIVDHDEQDLPVFESGAIMLYLADKHKKFLPSDVRRRAEVISWLMFQMGGLGPMQGQAAHFVKFAPEKIEYGIKRYTNETRRLYGVIEKALSDGRQWLAAGEYTIADMANFSWMYVHYMAGISLDDLPHVQAWMQRIEDRPAVRRGIDVPQPFDKEASKDPKKVQEAIDEVRKFTGTHSSEK